MVSREQQLDVIDSALRDKRNLFQSRQSSESLAYRKGIRLIFLNRDVDIEWQHKQSWGQWRGLRQEFSFLVNNYFIPGIELIGDRDEVLAKAVTF